MVSIPTLGLSEISLSFWHCCRRFHFLVITIIYFRSVCTMASTSIPLKLFPSPSSATLPPPRKSSLKHAAQARSTELKGLALQVTARPDATPTVQPASSHIKHSLFCDPDPSITSSSTRSQPKRQAHTRRRSSRNSLISLSLIHI